MSRDLEKKCQKNSENARNFRNLTAPAEALAADAARILGQDTKTALSARARVGATVDKVSTKAMHKTLVRKGEKKLSEEKELYESGMRARSNGVGGEISPSDPGPAWQKEAFKP